MSRRRRHVALSGLVFLASGIGCSLVYSYGTVEQATEKPDGSTGDDVLTIDAPTGMDHTSIPDTSDDGPVAVPDAPVTVNDGGPSNGADADAGPPPPPGGAVVIAGNGTGDGGIAYVLSVLDPMTGHELSRERLPVVGVVNDGVTDTWYIFEDQNPGTPTTLGPFSPNPGDPVVLHVRTLDTHTGKWTELTKLTVPTPASADLIAPLTNRLAYVGYPSPDAGTGEELVVLDTSNPAMTSAAPSDNAVSVTPLSFFASGMIGTRPNLTGAQGGAVTLVQNTASGTSAGMFQFWTVKVGASSVSMSGPVTLEPSTAAFQSVGVGSFLTGGPANVFALPDVMDAGVATIAEYDPSAGTSVLATPIKFGATTQRFRPVAISECAQMVFVGQLLGQEFFAVPLTSGGTPGLFDVTHSVSNVRFEPYSNTAITTFNGGAGYDITALSLGGTMTAPTLTPRTSIASVKPWAPPGDLRPTNIAVRQPIPFNCGQ